MMSSSSYYFDPTYDDFLLLLLSFFGVDLKLAKETIFSTNSILKTLVFQDLFLRGSMDLVLKSQKIVR